VSDLDLLLAEGIIDEICGRLKSGKEADISAVRRGDQILAAKVYKDRATRSFKNNADYKEGRKVRNSRTQRAIDSGGKFGRDSEEQAWKSAEADALYKLVGSGVRVPAPVMFYEGVLLMELVSGVDGQVAPRLIDVAIPPDDAMGIYADLVSQIISMLCCDLIHGDLSPYNILLGADGPTIIDFPQVVSAAHSTRAEFFFLRDFDNVLRFLVGFDPSLAVHRADGRAIWRAYVGRELTPQFVPPPPPPPQQQRRFERPRNDRGPRGPRIDNRGPQQPRPDNRGLQRSDRAFDTRGPQPAAPRTDRSFDNRGPQPAARTDRSFDSRGTQAAAPRTDRSFDTRGAQAAAPRTDRSFDTRGPQAAAPRTDRSFDTAQPAAPRTDRSFDTRGAQPAAPRADRSFDNTGPQRDRGPAGPAERNDGRGPRTDRPFDTRGPQPHDPQRRDAPTGQPRRSYGERFAGDRGGAPEPRNDSRSEQPIDRGTQPPPRDDFDWSQPRRSATQPQRSSGDGRTPPQRTDRPPSSDARNPGGQRNDRPASSDQRNPPRSDHAPSQRSPSDRFPPSNDARGPRTDRPRSSGPAFAVPPPRAPRARVDPRPPPPAGGHRRRPKRRS